jgi:N-acetylornithine carbamoyltransferase
MNFYDLSELPLDAVDRLASRAIALKSGAPARRFDGRALGLLFFDPSLRTQSSFQRAAGMLGLDLVHLTGGVWGIETEPGAVMDQDKAEHVKEAARVLGRYVDVLGVRAFAKGGNKEKDLADPLLRGFMEHAGVPVLNLESARFHPCQALADRVTLDESETPKHGKFVLTWAWHPKALPVAVPQSTLLMAAQRGMEVVVLRPEGYDLQQDVTARAEALAKESGGSVTVTSDRSRVAGAHAVYAKSWGSLLDYGDAAAEAARRADLRDWRVEAKTFATAPEAWFMHCLPVRRNVVVTDEVIDSERSIVIEQAENRLWAQLSVLESVLATAAPRRASRFTKRVVRTDAPSPESSSVLEASP